MSTFITLLTTVTLFCYVPFRPSPRSLPDPNKSTSSSRFSRNRSYGTSSPLLNTSCTRNSTRPFLLVRLSCQPVTVTPRTHDPSFPVTPTWLHLPQWASVGSKVRRCPLQREWKIVVLLDESRWVLLVFKTLSNTKTETRPVSLWLSLFVPIRKH